jgi:hypothetical protein
MPKLEHTTVQFGGRTTVVVGISRRFILVFVFEPPKMKATIPAKSDKFGLTFGNRRQTGDLFISAKGFRDRYLRKV